MKFMANLLARFRRNTDEKNDEVKRNTDELALLTGRIARTSEEMAFDERGVKATLSKRLPAGSTLLRCRNGFYIKRFGYAPLCGPCPNPKAAERTAMRNLSR